RDVLDLNIHIHPALPEPPQARVGRSPPILIFFKSRNGPVVNHLALFIAPARINHLPDGDLVNVACDHAIHQFGRVLARDQIFIERRYINQRASISNRVVLVLMVHFVHADRVVARPLSIVQAMAERKRSLVKCSSNRQGHPRWPVFLCVPLCTLWLSLFLLSASTQEKLEIPNAGLYAVAPSTSNKVRTLTASQRLRVNRDKTNGSR